MARYVIDARTLLALVNDERTVHGDHQLVPPNSTRSEAREPLPLDVLFAADDGK